MSLFSPGKRTGGKIDSYQTENYCRKGGGMGQGKEKSAWCTAGKIEVKRSRREFCGYRGSQSRLLRLSLGGRDEAHPASSQGVLGAAPVWGRGHPLSPASCTAHLTSVPRSNYWIHCISFSYTWVLSMCHSFEPKLKSAEEVLLLFCGLTFSIIMAMQLSCSPEELLWWIIWVRHWSGWITDEKLGLQSNPNPSGKRSLTPVSAELRLYPGGLGMLLGKRSFKCQ